MSSNNYIGLDTENSQKLAKNLNDLLANYQVFYMNSRGFHWNIKGEKFFELHVKFEELYNDLVVKIDEIAERVLTLGETPMHSFKDYLATSKIEAVENETNGKACVQHVLNAFKVIIEKQRAILDMSGEIDDEGTNALMSDYIREQEKLVWMYKAYLG